MAAILTLVQHQSIKPISTNNTDKFTLIEAEVEEVELRKLLGDALLKDIQDNPGNYTDVLDGAEFEDYNGNTLYQKGLRYITAYFVYSKYLGQSFVADTFTGFVQKTRTDSESLSEGTVRRLQEENRAIALTQWELLKKFLDINYEDYPLWGCQTYRKVFRPKLTGIKRTNYGR